MPAAPPAAPTLAGFVLDEARGALLAPDGTAAPLRPKTFALLQLLLRQRGELVGRQQILDEVWAGVTVTDDNVTQCIGEIRRALGEEGGRLLRTMPKRGYVLEVEEGEKMEAPELSPATASLASPHWWWPALTLLSALLVAAGWGLTRLTAPPAPVPLLASAPTPEAQQLFDQGRAAAYRARGARADNWLGARIWFERAIAADPGFAPAYAEAAFTHTNMVTSGLSADRALDLRQAEVLADRAAVLAPNLPVVHAARAAVLRLQRRPAEALKAYQTAVALDPEQHASRANIGLMLILLGRPREASEPILRSMGLAEASHPFTATWLTYLGIAELQLGQGDFGAERFRRSLERTAFLSLDIRRLYLAAALALQGQTEAAAVLVRDVRARQPAATAGWMRQQELSDEPAYLALQSNLYRGLALAGLPD